MRVVIALVLCVHSCYLGSKVLVSLLGLHLGLTEVSVGILASLYAAVPLVLGMYAGRLADTVPIRWPLLGGAICIGIAMLTGFLWQTVPALFAVAALAGAGFIFFNVAIQSLTGAVGLPEQRTRNFSVLSITYSVSTFTGPTTAGFGIDLVGFSATFLIFTVLAGVAAALLAFTRRFDHVKPAKKQPESRNTMDLLRMPVLRRIVMISALIVAAWDLFAFYLPVYAHSKGLSASAVGTILGTFAVAAFLTRFVLPALTRRWRGESIISFAMIISATGFSLTPLFTTMYPLMATAFLIGLGLGCGQPISMMMSYDRSPPGRTGEVTGLRLTANNVARVVIPVAAGALGTAVGIAPVFWMNALSLAGVSYASRR